MTLLRKLKLNILKFLKFIPTKLMLKIQYRLKLKRTLKFDGTERFTSKIQLYKIKYRNKLMHRLVDKELVKEYLHEIGYGHLVIETYGVYNDIKDINIEKLPTSFVAKKTNGGGGNEVIIVRNKEEIDKIEVLKKMKTWLKKSSYYHGGREWAYDGLKGKIIIERHLGPKLSDIQDYKFMCFKGKCEFIVYDFSRFNNHKRNIYNNKWEHLRVQSDCSYGEDTIGKPKNLEKMIKIAETLSRDFPFVRVDLYNIDGKIYFGEFTFYPWSGYVKFIPDEFDYKLGSKFKL